ncbi:MAG: hypothetical protein M3O29_08075, partial [Actinomycetota bacterium]|nr:hypothetical protein [Actinomycetota bacterium]
MERWGLMRSRRFLLMVLASVCAIVATTPAAPAHAAGARWVVDENALPGTRAWRIKTTAPTDIQGYADKVSAEPSTRVTLYVDTTAASFRVKAYRLGYYQGLGGRFIWSSKPHARVNQPRPSVDPDTLMVETQWSPSASFRVGDDWVQGSYLLKLISSTGGQSYIPLIIRDDASTAALVIQHQVFTWQAYNDWGGYSLYHGPDGFDSRSRVVSFDR